LQRVRTAGLNGMYLSGYWRYPEILELLVMQKNINSQTMKSSYIYFVVVQIILLLFQVTISDASSIDSAKSHAAKVQIKLFECWIDDFKKEIGRYPSQEEGLKILRENVSNLQTWKGPYIQKPIPLDPWGNEYVYLNPAKYGNKTFDIYSFGVNGKDDHGLKDDIASWSDIKREYYGGLRTIEKYSVLLSVFAIFACAALCILRIGRPSLAEITIRFARFSLISGALLFLYFFIVPASIDGDHSLYKVFLLGGLFLGWSGFSIFGTIMGAISIFRYGLILKQVLAIAICLLPWLFIGVTMLIS
jgi:general secretion pathway protein G